MQDYYYSYIEELSIDKYFYYRLIAEEYIAVILYDDKHLDKNESINSSSDQGDVIFSRQANSFYLEVEDNLEIDNEDEMYNIKVSNIYDLKYVMLYITWLIISIII